MYSSTNLHPVIRVVDKMFVVVAVLFLMNVATYFLVGNIQADVGYFVEQDNPFARLSWYPLYGMTILLALVYVVPVLKSLLYNPLIYLLLAITIASIVYSVEPEVTLRRVLALTMTVMIGIYFGVRPDWMQTLRLIGIGCAIFCLMQLVLIAGLSSTAIHQDVNAGAWRGMFAEKNALGASAAVSGLIFSMLAHLNRGTRWLWMFMVMIAVFLVIGSRSATALISFVIPVALYLLVVFTNDAPRTRLIVLYFGSLVAFVPVYLIVFEPELILGIFGKDVTLTGRTDIWNMTWSAIRERPWTGYGYAAFWQKELGPSYIISTQLEWTVPSAHNAWIEQGLHAGLPGVIGLAVLAGSVFLKSLIVIVKSEVAIPFVIVLQLVIFSLSESAALWWHNTFTCVLFVFASILAFRPLPRSRKQGQPRW